MSEKDSRNSAAQRAVDGGTTRDTDVDNGSRPDRTDQVEPGEPLDLVARPTMCSRENSAQGPRDQTKDSYRDDPRRTDGANRLPGVQNDQAEVWHIRVKSAGSPGNNSADPPAYVGDVSVTESVTDMERAAVHADRVEHMRGWLTTVGEVTGIADKQRALGHLARPGLDQRADEQADILQTPHRHQPHSSPDGTNLTVNGQP